MDSQVVAGKGKQHFHHHHHHHHRHHHHHHVFHISSNCPHHRPILQPNNHSPSLCSFSNNSHHNTLLFDSAYTNFNDALMVLDESASADLVVEDELDEEPTFVLTDEWKEFFAKSEAKRKLAKKQAKKKNKN